jgi:hypothetical protein
MNNIILIRYLLSRDTYQKYRPFVNTNYIKDNEPELHKIYLALDKLFDAIPEQTHFSVGDLQAFFFSQYPALKKADREAANLIFETIEHLDVGEQVLEIVLETHRERSAAFEIASRAYDIADGKGSFLDLSETFKGYEKGFKPEDEEIQYVTQDLAELHQETYAKPGLKWKHKTLRKMMGSLRNDFGFLFTRPEVGKTTLIADCGSYFAHQLPIGRPLLHFNNEEMGAKVMIRYYQGALGITAKELFSDLKGNQARFLDYTKGNVKLYDTASLEKSKVEDICAKENPGLIIFDSVDKLKGFKDDRDDLVYKQIYQWCRELAKTYGPVIGVCHAAVSAEGKPWLEMDDVAYAKTAKQGEADWILGIGQVHEDGKEKIRHFHLPKNKLMGDEEMDEQFRHGKLVMRINPEIGQYSDILNFD